MKNQMTSHLSPRDTFFLFHDNPNDTTYSDNALTFHSVRSVELIQTLFKAEIYFFQ